MCCFLQVSKTLHNKYLSIVFNAPINLYFDVTSIGMILSRFSKDLGVIDETLWLSFSSLLGCFYIALSVLIVASIAVYWMIIVVVVFFLIAVCLFSYSTKAYKDTQKIEALSWSQLVSHFQETFSGKTVIRAYRRENAFLTRSNQLMNRITLAN